MTLTDYRRGGGVFQGGGKGNPGKGGGKGKGNGGGGGGGGPVFPAGVISYWRFDDGSGTVADDSIGSDNGTLVNSPAWSTDAKMGSHSLDFSGATNRSVNLTTVYHLAGQIVSWGMWAKRTGTADNCCALGWESNTYLTLIYRSDRGGLCLQQSNTLGGVAIFAGLNQPMTVGQYYLIGYTYIGTTLTLFINGVQVATGYFLIGGGAGDKPFTIGNFQPSGINAWDGIIDEAFLFHRVLSASEWLDVYNGGAGLRP